MARTVFASTFLHKKTFEIQKKLDKTMFWCYFIAIESATDDFFLRTRNLFSSSKAVPVRKPAQFNPEHCSRLRFPCFDFDATQHRLVRYSHVCWVCLHSCKTTGSSFGITLPHGIISTFQIPRWFGMDHVSGKKRILCRYDK